VTGHEFALRSHLLGAHGWTPAVVEEFFAETGTSYNGYRSRSRSGGADGSGGASDEFSDVFRQLFENTPTSRVDPTPDTATVGYDAGGVDAVPAFEGPESTSTNVDRPEAGERTVSPGEFRSATGGAEDEGPATTTPPVESSAPLSSVCDCDPKFKETQIIQKDTGLSLGGIGGNRETGMPVIICKNCATQYAIRKEPSRGGRRFLGWRD
jgi:hypothetical protein